MKLSSRSEYHKLSQEPVRARVADRNTLGEAAFHRMISLERRRTSRSQKSFLLMLIDLGETWPSESSQRTLRKLLNSLSPMLRETDVTGWYRENAVVGVMLTEVTEETQESIPTVIMGRLADSLKAHLTAEQFRNLGISFHLLSEAETEARARSAHAV